MTSTVGEADAGGAAGEASPSADVGPGRPGADRRRVEGALDEIDTLGRELPAGLSEARNLVTVARLVARAALARPESRGGHFRADHPDSRSVWRRRLVLSRNGDREQIAFEPVPAPSSQWQEASA